MGLNKWGAISIVAGVLVIGGVVLGAGSMVGVGEIGIVKHMDGQVTTINTGWNWTGYGVAVDKLPTGVQQLTLSADTNEGGKQDQSWSISTNDGQKLIVSTNLLWQINPKDAASIYKETGGENIDYIQSIVRTQMKNVVNSITPKYDWSFIYGSGKKQVTDEINTALQADLSSIGLELPNNHAFGFSDIEPPQGMQQTQSALAQAELAKQKAQQDQATQQVQNQTKIMNAQADAKAAQIEAEGTKAKADALNELVIQEEEIQKWDGKLPSVQGGNGSMMLNIPSTQAGK